MPPLWSHIGGGSQVVRLNYLFAEVRSFTGSFRETIERGEPSTTLFHRCLGQVPVLDRLTQM